MKDVFLSGGRSVGEDTVTTGPRASPPLSRPFIPDLRTFSSRIQKEEYLIRTDVQR